MNESTTSQELTIVEQSSIVSSEEAVEGNDSFVRLLQLGSEVGFTTGLLVQDEAIEQISTDVRMQIIDAYNVEPLPFSEVCNQTLLVLGAAIWEVEPGLHKDGSYRERYFQGRILVEIDGKQQRLIKTSGSSLLRHIAHMCRLQGWFLFKEPLKYKFVWKGAGKPHIMERVR